MLKLKIACVCVCVSRMEEKGSVRGVLYTVS
jgi:hypothetical protein